MPISRPVRSRRGKVARITREPTLEEVSKNKDEDKAEDNVYKEDTALFNKLELSNLLDKDEEDEE